MFITLLTLLQDTTDFSTSSKGRANDPPDGPLFYLIIVIASVIVLATVIYTIKWFIWPGEKSEDHIKRKILESESQEPKDNE